MAAARGVLWPSVPSVAAASIYTPWVSLSHPHPSLGGSPRSASRSGLGFYHICAFAWGPSKHEILCASFKIEVSVSPSPVGLP